MAISTTTGLRIHDQILRIRICTEVLVIAGLSGSVTGLISLMFAARFGEMLIKAAMIALIAGGGAYQICKSLLRMHTAREIYDRLGFMAVFATIGGFFLAYPLFYALGWL